MYLKKELSVTMDLVIFKNELEETKYDEDNLELLLEDLINGDFKKTRNDSGPIYIQHLFIDNIEKEWQVEIDSPHTGLF
jgi:hypothetical protein